MWRAVVALLLAFILCSLLCTAQIFPTRQLCADGTECIFLDACPDMITLVRSGYPANIRRVRQAICGFQGRRSLVCCPFDGGYDEEPAVTHETGHSHSNLLPGPGLCGRPRVGDKIIGGAPAPLGGYPWVAAMGYTEPGSDKISYICTGSLISSKYILTAAHCVHPKELGKKRLAVIHLGDWDLNSPGRDCQVTRLGTQCNPPHIAAGYEKIVMHPQYDTRGRSSDDIALIKLNITIDFDHVEAAVEPVCLPTSNLDVRALVDKKRPIAAGWGLTEHGNHSNVMLRVDVPLVSDNLCKERYAEDFVGNQICVGGEQGLDTCSGDSGGPLIIPETMGPPFTQIGIVSFGPFPCGLDMFPGVYTSVKDYIGWIKENLQS